MPLTATGTIRKGATTTWALNPPFRTYAAAYGGSPRTTARQLRHAQPMKRRVEELLHRFVKAKERVESFKEKEADVAITISSFL